MLKVVSWVPSTTPKKTDILFPSFLLSRVFGILASSLFSAPVYSHFCPQSPNNLSSHRFTVDGCISFFRVAFVQHAPFIFLRCQLFCRVFSFIIFSIYFDLWYYKNLSWPFTLLKNATLISPNLLLCSLDIVQLPFSNIDLTIIMLFNPHNKILNVLCSIDSSTYNFNLFY